MTRDGIIRMAREAGLCDSSGEDDDSVNIARQLERFADAFSRSVEYAYKDMLDAAVRAEREACAKLCEEYDDDRGAGETWGPRFAAIIRARTP